MAQTIKLKRSAVQGNIPTTAQLEFGELAINTYDGKIYLKRQPGAVPEEIVDMVNSLDLASALAAKAGVVSGATDNNFVNFDSAGNIQDLGYNAADFATAVQGSLANTALQPGDNLSSLTNDAGFLTNLSSQSINDLSDVDTTGVSNGDILKWNGTTFIATTPTSSGEANTAINLGSGSGIYSSKVVAELRFKSLVAGANVSLTSDANTITINSTGGGGSGETNTASNLGAGQGVFATKVAEDLRFKSLVAGANISMGADANTIVINATNIPTSIDDLSDVNTTGITAGQVLEWTGTEFVAGDKALPGAGEANTASNIGGGTGIFATKVSTDLQFKSLIAGSNVNFVTDADSITINSVSLDAVDSVNGQTGAVVLDADDISDATTTNKFATAAELALIASAVQPGDNVSTLVNDANYISSGNNISELVNDAGYIPDSEKGIANGVATLGPTGLVPNSQLPPLAITNTFVVANQAAMLALSTAETGDVAVRTDESKSYILQGTDPSVLGDWQELLAPTAAVISVNGQIGAVVLDKTDIGLNNVDNTSDLNKPISTAMQAALDTKLETGDNVSDLVNDAGYLTSLGSIGGHTDVSLLGIAPGDYLQWNGSAFLPSAGTSAVLSVNGQTGVVLLDADDIDDTSTTNKFVTAAQITLINTSVQPGDNVSDLVNDAGYLTSLGSIGGHTDVDLTGITSGDILEWNGSTFVAVGAAGSGEANTASNLGAGEGVFATKVVDDLQFKSLVAGTNVSLVSDANTITISASSGEVNTASNLGAGEGTFANKVGSDLQFKSLVAGTNISLSSNATSITMIGPDIWSSIAGDSGISTPTGADTLTVSGGAGITTTSSGGTLSIDWAASIGQLSDVDLTGISSNDILQWNGSTFVAAAPSAGGGEANTASNLGAGEGVFAAKVSEDLQFKSLVAGTNISLTSDANTITINSTSGGTTEYVKINYTLGNIIGTLETSTGISAVATVNSVNTNLLINVTFTASIGHTRPPTSIMVYGYDVANANYIVQEMDMSYGGQPTYLNASGPYDITSGSIVGLVMEDIQVAVGATNAAFSFPTATHAYVVFGW